MQVPTSFEDLSLMNSRDHLQTRGSHFSVITMPQTRDGSIKLEMNTLQAALQREIGGIQLSDQEGDVEQGDMVQVYAEPPRAEMCFKVLKGNPAKGKSITTFVLEGGAVLNHQDFTVTVHHVLRDVGMESPNAVVVDMCPRIMF